MARVLFVCLRNAGRSQMSEALFARAAAGHWELEDPKGRPIEEVRPTRDEIERRVVELIDELND